MDCIFSTINLLFQLSTLLGPLLMIAGLQISPTDNEYIGDEEGKLRRIALIKISKPSLLSVGIWLTIIGSIGQIMFLLFSTARK